MNFFSKIIRNKIQSRSLEEQLIDEIRRKRYEGIDGLMLRTVEDLRWDGDMIGGNSIQSQKPNKSQAASPKEKASKVKDIPAKQRLGPKKQDLSQVLLGFAHVLTDRQYEIMSLRMEWGLSMQEIAIRLDITKQTVQEHIRAASCKMDAARHNEHKKPGINRNE